MSPACECPARGRRVRTMRLQFVFPTRELTSADRLFDQSRTAVSNRAPIRAGSGNVSNRGTNASRNLQGFVLKIAPAGCIRMGWFPILQALPVEFVWSKILQALPVESQTARRNGACHSNY